MAQTSLLEVLRREPSHVRGGALGVLPDIGNRYIDVNGGAV